MNLHLLTTCLLAVPFMASVDAQQKVLPGGMDFVEGPLVYTYPFGRATAAIQLLYDADQVTLQQGVVLGMHLRQSRVTATQLYPSYTKNYQVTAYTVAASAASMAADPAINIGSATGTVVFQGPLTLPAVTNVTTFPAPFGIHIPFSVPYAFDGSTGNLLLVLETADTAAVPTGSYRIDAVLFNTGTTTGIAANLDDLGCTVAGKSLLMAINAAPAVVGGSIDQTMTSSATGAFPVVLAALSLGIQPISLAVFGMPGCTSWLAPFEMQFAFENSGGGYPTVTWALPLDPGIEGLPLAGQALGIAPTGLLSDSVTSNGVAVRIGRNGPPIVKANMSFRAAGAWSMGGTGAFLAVVALDGVFP
jgi:hypothetical protein